MGMTFAGAVAIKASAGPNKFHVGRVDDFDGRRSVKLEACQLPLIILAKQECSQISNPSGCTTDGTASSCMARDHTPAKEQRSITESSKS